MFRQLLLIPKWNALMVTETIRPRVATLDISCRPLIHTFRQLSLSSRSLVKLVQGRTRALHLETAADVQLHTSWAVKCGTAEVEKLQNLRIVILIMTSEGVKIWLFLYMCCIVGSPLTFHNRMDSVTALNWRSGEYQNFLRCISLNVCTCKKSPTATFQENWEAGHDNSTIFDSDCFLHWKLSIFPSS